MLLPEGMSRCRRKSVSILSDVQKLICSDSKLIDAALNNCVTPLLLIDANLSNLCFNGLCYFLFCVIYCCTKHKRYLQFGDFSAMVSYRVVDVIIIFETIQFHVL